MVRGDFFWCKTADRCILILNKICRVKIKVGKDRLVWEGKFSRVYEREFFGVDGKPGTWEVFARKTHGPVAIVIPVTEKGDVIFLKHFRVPRAGYVLETPAGLMDRRGEKSIALARRELLEETGYVARRIKFVGSGANNGGLQNEDYHFFIATGCVKKSEPAYEAAEDIEVLLVPLARVEKFLSARRNFAVAAPLFGVPYFLRRAGLLN